MKPFREWTQHDVDEWNRLKELERKQRITGGAVAVEEESSTPLSLEKSPEPKLESDLHDQIMDFCRPMGWLVVHSRMDRKTTTAKGVSDFIIIAPKFVAFVEAKRKGNKPTPDQLAFLAHVKQMGWPNAIVYNIFEFTDFIQGLL